MAHVVRNVLPALHAGRNVIAETRLGPAAVVQPMPWVCYQEVQKKSPGRNVESKTDCRFLEMGCIKVPLSDTGLKCRHGNLSLQFSLLWR